MITLENLEGEPQAILIEGVDTLTIDCTRLTLLPALIDPHVHFRTPGAEHKENWETGARAALAGGVTYVCDMPNTKPLGISMQALAEKRQLIDAQLRAVGIPLRYDLYLGAAKGMADEGRCAFALKIFMGSSTGDLLVDDDEALSAAFALAASQGLAVAVHAEEERLIARPSGSDPAEHSKIRSPEVAAVAVARAVELAEKHSVRLYILHVSSQAELDLIRQAKRRGTAVYAEATPHHLFLTTDAYRTLGTRALVNPPLRSASDQEALWEGLVDGTIDWIGTDHAPHLPSEKDLPYGQALAGMAGLETMLPLLLTAVEEGRLQLADVVRLTHTNPSRIFGIDIGSDCVLVDLKKRKSVLPRLMQSRAGWSPFQGRILTGWPVYTIIRGRAFHVADGVVARVTREVPAWHPQESRIYHHEKSYSENLVKGPFLQDVLPLRAIPPASEWLDFLGTPVASRLGVPAGPLLNSRWISLAAKLGFDILTYKTIRSHAFPGHPLPNVLPLNAPTSVTPGAAITTRDEPITTREQLSITNSFGNPTQERAYLAEDIPRSAAAMAPYQALVISVVGVPYKDGGMGADFCRAASYACQLGGTIIEANFSCPNVATSESSLYQDPESIREIAAAIVQRIAPRPLIMKMGAITDRGLLHEVLTAASEAGVRAVAGINTVKMEILDSDGQPALGEARRHGGVCGAATREIALNFVTSSREIIQRKSLPLTLIGMGGVTEPEHFDLFLSAGADFVQSATGMMWDPYLALRYHMEKYHGYERAHAEATRHRSDQVR